MPYKSTYAFVHGRKHGMQQVREPRFRSIYINFGWKYRTSQTGRYFRIIISSMHMFLLFVCLFGVYHPTQEFFTHMKTSLLPVKDREIRHTWLLSS